jgi:hypothetical protein
MIGQVPTFWFCALSAGTGSAQGARSSAEEHYVDIVGVTGSIPVAPTIISNWGIKDFLRTPKPFIRLARQAGKQRGSTSGYLGAVSPAGPTTFPPRGLTKRAIIVRFRIRAPSNKNYLYFPAVLFFEGGGFDLSASTAIIPQDDLFESPSRILAFQASQAIINLPHGLLFEPRQTLFEFRRFERSHKSIDQFRDFPAAEADWRGQRQDNLPCVAMPAQRATEKCQALSEQIASPATTRYGRFPASCA